jgi:uncharacterized membrane protein YgdD (TMEM256/DUF423 family)
MFYVERLRIDEPLWQALTYIWCPLFMALCLILIGCTFFNRQTKRLRWQIPLLLISTLVFAGIVHMAFTSVKVLVMH